MTDQPSKYGSPWYQNFWPWFIVGLLGISVIGSLFTVALAYRHRDVDVRIGAPLDAAPSARPSSSSDAERRDSGR